MRVFPIISLFLMVLLPIDSLNAALSEGRSDSFPKSLVRFRTNPALLLLSDKDSDHPNICAWENNIDTDFVAVLAQVHRKINEAINDARNTVIALCKKQCDWAKLKKASIMFNSTGQWCATDEDRSNIFFGSEDKVWRYFYQMPKSDIIYTHTVPMEKKSISIFHLRDTAAEHYDVVVVPDKQEIWEVEARYTYGASLAIGQLCKTFPRIVSRLFLIDVENANKNDNTNKCTNNYKHGAGAIIKRDATVIPIRVNASFDSASYDHIDGLDQNWWGSWNYTSKAEANKLHIDISNGYANPFKNEIVQWHELDNCQARWEELARNCACGTNHTDPECQKQYDEYCKKLDAEDVAGHKKRVQEEYRSWHCLHEKSLDSNLPCRLFVNACGRLITKDFDENKQCKNKKRLVSYQGKGINYQGKGINVVLGEEALKKAASDHERARLYAEQITIKNCCAYWCHSADQKYCIEICDLNSQMVHSDFCNTVYHHRCVLDKNYTATNCFTFQRPTSHTSHDSGPAFVVLLKPEDAAAMHAVWYCDNDNENLQYKSYSSRAEVQNLFYNHFAKEKKWYPIGNLCVQGSADLARQLFDYLQQRSYEKVPAADITCLDFPVMDADAVTVKNNEEYYFRPNNLVDRVWYLGCDISKWRYDFIINSDGPTKFMRVFTYPALSCLSLLENVNKGSLNWLNCEDSFSILPTPEGFVMGAGILFGSLVSGILCTWPDHEKKIINKKYKSNLLTSIALGAVSYYCFTHPLARCWYTLSPFIYVAYDHLLMGIMRDALPMPFSKLYNSWPAKARRWLKEAKKPALT